MKTSAQQSLLYCLLLFAACERQAQDSKNYYWENRYHSSCFNKASCFHPSDNGDFILGGNLEESAWFVSIDCWGDMNWNSEVNSSFNEALKYRVESILGSPMDGFVAVGFLSTPSDYGDALISSFDNHGSLLWQLRGGGTAFDCILDICKSHDGGYMLLGATESNGEGLRDIWLLEMDQDGEILWQQCYGGSGRETGFDIEPVSDESYIIAGHTNSSGSSSYDYCLIKTDRNGRILWQKAYGGPGIDEARCVLETPEGDFLVAGFYQNEAWDLDIWLLKLDKSGAVLWSRSFGGSGSDVANSLMLNDGGAYYLAGTTDSYGAGSSDLLLFKFDEDGAVQWQKSYGGSESDEASSIARVNDSTILLTGWTSSFNEADKLQECGNDASQFWVLKLDLEGEGTAYGREESLAIVPRDVEEVNTSFVQQSSAAEFIKNHIGE